MIPSSDLADPVTDAAAPGTDAQATGAREAKRGRKRLPLPLALGSTVLGIIFLIAVIGPVIWRNQASTLGTTFRAGPSAQHLLGTDALGRDLLARTLTATRLTVLMAILATLIAVGAGIGLGATIVLARPKVRAIGERLIDLLVAYPPIIVALAVTAIFRPSETSVVIAIGLAFTPQFARLTNRMAASVREKDFVTVAQALGLRRGRVLWQHILPNLAGPLLVLASVGFASAIITLSGLSFIGLGVQQPAYDWGALLSSGLQDLNVNPIEVVGPALGILITGLAAGLIGDGLNEYLDPRRRMAVGRERRRRHKEPPASLESATDVRVADGNGGTPTAAPFLRSDSAAGTDTGPDEPAVAVATGATEADELVVSARNLWVAASSSTVEAPIVRGVSLDIARGEMVGLVGESGSGKTLTAMAIARLLSPSLVWSATALTVSGRDVRPSQEKAPREMATGMGIVFQDPSSSFNPARHIGPQLTEVSRVHGGMSKQKANALAVERLRETQVSSPELRMHQYPHELSGGMRQRAMISMALMTSPSILIADEPTTALDVTVQADVLRLLRRLNTTYGMAILLISHDISVVSSLCDRICVMYAGRIVEELSSEQLRAKRICHPYTRALLAAAPLLDLGARQSRLVPLPGRPPRAGEPISGCSFAARCPLATDICRTVDPHLRDLGGGGRIACHVSNGPLEELHAGE